MGTGGFRLNIRGLGFAVVGLALLVFTSVAAALGVISGLPIGATSADPSCSGKPATIVGTAGNDQLGGTPDRDVIAGLGGDDKISAKGGADLICAGGGNDIVAGEGGHDRISGGAADDLLLGGNGNDKLLGGPGEDGCTGGAGRNTLEGCEGRTPPGTTRLLADSSPAAVDDSARFAEDASATAIDVLANDTDLDGGPKSIAGVAQPSHGTVTITGGGSGLTYAPSADYCGADSFTYSLNGGSVGTVAVSASCTDDPPVAVNDAPTVEEDATATALAVLANDPDLDGGPKSIVGLTQPANGTVLATGGGSGLTYEPDEDYCNDSAPADIFTYTLNGGSSATVSIAVACVDDPPLAVDDSADFTEDDSPTSIAVLANDTDVDGGPISIAAKSDPNHGSVTVGAGGSGISYATAGNYCGTDSFTYTLNGGSIATVAVSVSCVDDAPVAVADSFELTQDDDLALFAVIANDTDVDAGPISITAVEQPDHGTASIVGGGNSIEYLPEGGYCNDGGAPETFSYTVSGGNSAEVAASVECLATSPDAVELTGSPGLFPSFDRAVDDYYVRCADSPVEIAADVATDYEISIDGAAPQSGSVEVTVPLADGQAFTTTVTRGAGQHRYYVRCLPSDFPVWNFERSATPSHEFYVVAPALGPPAKYVVVFDDHGVPLWWFEEPNTPFDVKIFPEGNIGWTHGAGAVDIRSFDGTLQRSLETVGVLLDVHDVIELPNGNTLLMSYPSREHVDMAAYGGGTDETLFDAYIQEIDSSGNVVWDWNSFDHISLDETGRWYTINKAKWNSSTQWDVTHINAFEPVGDDSLLISLRHTDAIYKIRKDTGEVVWKLGGTPTPESLSVLNDPADPTLGGQHDVRLQADGTITLYDNRTGLSGSPRAVRYQIDETEKKATLVEQVADPLVTTSNCCGSARRSADGSWLMSWGGRPLVTEFNAAKQRTFKLEFQLGVFSYRAAYVPDGAVSAAQLRAGMDQMHPR